MSWRRTVHGRSGFRLRCEVQPWQADYAELSLLNADRPGRREVKKAWMHLGPGALRKMAADMIAAADELEARQIAEDMGAPACEQEVEA